MSPCAFERGQDRETWDTEGAGRAKGRLISEDSFKQVLDLDGWREGMLFAWVSRGKSVGGIGLYSRRRRMDNRCPGNTIPTESGSTRQKMTAGLFAS
jgi:hypothetical protein